MKKTRLIRQSLGHFWWRKQDSFDNHWDIFDEENKIHSTILGTFLMKKTRFIRQSLGHFWWRKQDSFDNPWDIFDEENKIYSTIIGTFMCRISRGIIFLTSKIKNPLFIEIFLFTFHTQVKFSFSETGCDIDWTGFGLSLICKRLGRSFAFSI